MSRKYRTKDEWNEIVAKFKKSGQSVKDFARAEGISPAQIYTQAKRLAKPQKSEGGGFVKFVAATDAHLNGHIRVTLKSGATCEVSAQNVEGLKTILRATGDLA